MEQPTSVGVCRLDVHGDSVATCIRVLSVRAIREQHLQTLRTTTAGLFRLRD